MACGGSGTKGRNGVYKDLSERLSNKVQLTTDGHKVYLNAVESAFGGDIDYAMLVKIYGPDPGRREEIQPPSVHRSTEVGYLWKAGQRLHFHQLCRASELTMRMNMRRFTCRLHEWLLKEGGEPRSCFGSLLHGIQLCSDSQDAGVTPAMAAGVTDKLWNMEDVVNLIEKNSN